MKKVCEKCNEKISEKKYLRHTKICDGTVKEKSIDIPSLETKLDMIEDSEILEDEDNSEEVEQEGETFTLEAEGITVEPINGITDTSAINLENITPTICSESIIQITSGTVAEEKTHFDVIIPEVTDKEDSEETVKTVTEIVNNTVIIETETKVEDTIKDSIDTKKITVKAEIPQSSPICICKGYNGENYNCKIHIFAPKCPKCNCVTGIKFEGYRNPFNYYKCNMDSNSFMFNIFSGEYSN